ncbi:hypothetical protein EVAR_85078_1 [Eumeta japonica]|uniref:Uncharacterized protein n=1 Tax=Eumeta variegata TaxID=151549 RepID=A0A4C1XEZ4_EUMVA|nr:hypothetical protein EVAR_85078_1 [Eumeta japonica]
MNEGSSVMCPGQRPPRALPPPPAASAGALTSDTHPDFAVVEPNLFQLMTRSVGGRPTPRRPAVTAEHTPAFVVLRTICSVHCHFTFEKKSPHTAKGKKVDRSRTGSALGPARAARGVPRARRPGDGVQTDLPNRTQQFPTVRTSPN